MIAFRKKVAAAVLVGSLLVVLSSCEQRDTPPAPPPAAAPAPEVEVVPVVSSDQRKAIQKALLWEVTSASGATSHLLGIYGDRTDFPGLESLPDRVRSTFEASERVVLEGDAGSAAPSEMLELITLPAGTSLQKQLQPNHWETLLAEARVPAETVNKYQPWVALSVLQQNWAPGLGLRGMNDRFLILAREHGKALTVLETPRERAELMSRSVSSAMLAAALDDPQEAKKRLLELDEAFRAGDGEAFAKKLFSDEERARWPLYYDRFFYQRSARWAASLTPILAQGKVLVALSAPHLLGERGVVQLLGASGFTLKPL